MLYEYVNLMGRKAFMHIPLVYINDWRLLFIALNLKFVFT